MIEKKKLNIAYFGTLTYKQGGATRSMLRLVELFHKHEDQFLKWNVVAILPDKKDIYYNYLNRNLPVKIIKYQRPQKRKNILYLIKFVINSFITILKLQNFIRKEKIKIIHINEYVFFQGILAGKIAGAKIIIHFRGFEYNYLIRKLYITLINLFSSYNIFVSDRLKKMWILSGIKPYRTRTIYNPGPDYKIFNPKKYESSEISKSEIITIVCISKLHPNKGQDVLIEAARILFRKRTDFKILIVGGKLEGWEWYENKLKNLVKRYSLINNIFFLGLQENIPKILAKSDIAIHVPIHHDPLPGVVLEAMAMNVPIIGSDSGGIPEEIKDSKMCKIIKRNDPHELADTIIELSHKLKQKKNISKEVFLRELVMRRFNVNNFYKEMKKSYRYVISDLS